LTLGSQNTQQNTITKYTVSQVTWRNYDIHVTWCVLSMFPSGIQWHNDL